MVDNIVQKVASWASDLGLGVFVFWAWLNNDVQHVIAVVTPIGLPAIFFLRCLVHFEEWKIKRQQRRNLEYVSRRNAPSNQGTENEVH